MTAAGATLPKDTSSRLGHGRRTVVVTATGHGYGEPDLAGFRGWITGPMRLPTTRITKASRKWSYRNPTKGRILAQPEGTDRRRRGRP